MDAKLRRLLPFFFLILIMVYLVIWQERSNGPVIKVMTWNIHHAEGMDGKVDLQRIADVINKEQADFVLLQEVDSGVERTAKLNFPALLEKATGMKAFFGNNIVFQGGDYGNLLLSRYPLISAENHSYKMLREGEQRGLINVVADIDGSKIAVMNTHIDYRPDDSERLSNVEEIYLKTDEYKDMPVIIGGDFNDLPLSKVYFKMLNKFVDSWMELHDRDGFTFPADNPVKRIDYIFYRNSLGNKKTILRPFKVKVIKTDASDHLPILATFEIGNEESFFE